MESGSTFQPMVWQIAEDLSRADVLLRLPGHSPMPAFRAVEDIPLIARLPRRSRAEVAHCQSATDAPSRLHARQCVAQHQGMDDAVGRLCALLNPALCPGAEGAGPGAGRARGTADVRRAACRRLAPTCAGTFAYESMDSMSESISTC